MKNRFLRITALALLLSQFSLSLSTRAAAESPELSSEEKIAMAEMIEEATKKKISELEQGSTEETVTNLQLSLKEEMEKLPKRFDKLHAMLSGGAALTAAGLFGEALFRKYRGRQLTVSIVSGLAFSGMTVLLYKESKKIGKSEALMRMRILLNQIRTLKNAMKSESASFKKAKGIGTDLIEHPDGN
jgi:hypothetical protein